MRTLKHLPENEWPEADRQSLRAAYEPGDIFDETAGPGAHLAESSRKAIKFAYRRWLGFLRTMLTTSDLAWNERFHRIDGSKDSNFWSVRVNADIRLESIFRCVGNL